MKAAKLITNTQDWIVPSNSENSDVGVLVNLPNNIQIRYGYEEWLFNETLKQHKIGFLECYRHRYYPNVEKVMLFANFNQGDLFHVGNIIGVQSLTNNDILPIRETLGQDWLNFVNQCLSFYNNNLNLNVPIGAYQHWNSQSVIKDALNGQLGFAFNIKYKEIEYLKKPVNMTSLDPLVNVKWKRLSKRYIVNKLVRSLNQDNELVNYLNTLQ